MRVKPIKCPSCGAVLNIKKGDTTCECDFCGNVFHLDNGRTEHTYNKNVNIRKETYHTERYIDDADVIRAKNEGKSDRIPWIIIASVLVICILALAVIGVRDMVMTSQGKTIVGSYDDFIGEDYRTVVAHFESAGFTNIDLIDLDDSGVLFWKDEKVESVSVGGNMRFNEDNYFSPDTKVVISYH